ncbi:Rad52/Rad22 family DNA repair protein [Roseisolibacter sp. H3M3-2]|uniref:Rad52/Rad22 family DNA repair protein n=1 Tax=Roseisolibacter sp. H3M3-2 TaxID=3031323 RepID=UPI0023DA4C4D|nr:Rad52/Rad22 family DNA repair protein [Roseisolibacter sp. H3M3-2]MDF1502060.1 Rad52/Rad22 family DNA repair protein [Roseisolibacter sp. H3M3-2]
MIARHEAQVDKADLWSALAAPLPAGAMSWRQDGRAVERDGRWVARFVAYVDANTVRERLDAVVPGEWDLTLDLLPPLAGRDEDEGNHGALQASFKARLQILGVIREDVGTGRDYKAAATDAFKRAAVRFGIGHELYAMEPNWVKVDGDGRYAKPLEDPQVAYERRLARRGNGNGAALVAEPAPERTERVERTNGRADRVSDRPAAVAVSAEPSLDAMPASAVAVTLDPEQVACPKCGGRTWDNRLTKRNPKAPDFKCRDRSCDGVVWPPRGAAAAQDAPAPERPAAAGPAPKRKEARAAERAAVAEAVTFDVGPLGASSDDDDLPF